jgi:uncharacterized glyoxalase superfamily protein PhnB
MKEKTTHATVAKPIPEGFSTITPFLVVDGAEAFLEFIEKAFDGETTIDMKSPNGQVMHATSQIGDSKIMIADAMPGFKAMPCMLYVYVENIDEVYKQALKAGGTSLREPVNEFYGDRSAGITDKWNNQWWIATHIEDVDEEEMYKRAEKLNKQ